MSEFQTLDPKHHQKAWSLPNIVRHFKDARKTTEDVYPSEWIFLSKALREKMRILDVGCAAGGFASMFEEHLKEFSYTGVDISLPMVQEAKHAHPNHTFLHVKAVDSFALHSEFDLVLALGIYPLTQNWEDACKEAWRWVASGGALLVDVREHTGPTLQDASTSYLQMDYGDVRNQDEKAQAKQARLPYIVLNMDHCVQTLQTLCAGYSKITRFGYTHPGTKTAVTPAKEIFMSTYFIEKE